MSNRPILIVLTVAVLNAATGLCVGATPAPVFKQLAEMPLGFEPNRGQAPAAIDYVSTGASATIALNPGGASLKMLRAGGSGVAELGLGFAGGSASAKPSADQLLRGFTQSYFIGSDSSKWISNVPKYGQVRYRNVWPGIDVLFYGNGRQLEYDFIIAPGADPSSIGLKFSGADALALEASGDLRISTAAGPVVQKAPVIYQEIDGVRRKVSGRFAMSGDGNVRFALGSYDHSHQLVIDPLLIYYSRLFNSLLGAGIAVNGTDGTAYVVGQGISVSTPGILQAFLYSINSSGGVTGFTFGGNDGDTSANAVAVDSANNVYITGTTKASNLTTAGFQPTFGDGARSGNSDAYMVKFSTPNGGNASSLYATYIGGSGNDFGNAIAVDNTGKAYVGGTTCASNFRTTAGSPTFRAASCTAFAVKIDPAFPNPGDARSLVYSTLVGGTGADTGAGIAVDSGGNAYLAGSTTSTSVSFLPSTSTGFTTSKTNANQDGYLVKLAPSGSAAAWLTFIGGGPVSGLAVDVNGNAFVTGQTTVLSPVNSTNVGFQVTPQGGTDAFLERYNTGVNGAGAFVYFTYLGGSGNDVGYAIATDNTGIAYFVGSTSSSNFPATVTTLVPSPSAPPDGFIAQVNTNASGISSEGSIVLLGGDNNDDVRAIALDPSGAVLLTGTTASSNFGGQTGQSGSGAYVIKGTLGPIVPPSGCTYSLAPTSASIPANGTNNGTIQLTTSQPSCAWAATFDKNFVHVISASGESGTGSATITYTIYPNFSTLARTANITIGGQNFSISQAAQTGTSDQRFVELLYFNFFGRLPSAAEIQFQITQGLQMGLSRADLVNNFFNSAEFNGGGRFIVGLYFGILNRYPDYVGWLFQRNALAQGGATQTSLVTGFINSPEFQTANGTLTDAQFVTLLYQQVLLRTPSQSEIDFQINGAIKPPGSRTQFATSLLNSQEFQNGTGPRLSAFLLYAAILQRGADQASELDVRASQIRTGTPLKSLITGFVNSAEFSALLQ